VSDIGQQNDNAGSSGNFSLSVDDNEYDDDVSVVPSKSNSAVEEFKEQCSDDEFDAESFQRRRQDERRFSRLLDIAKSMYASVETKPVPQAPQTKKRLRSSSSGNASPSVTARQKFQCRDASVETCVAETPRSSDPVDLPAKDLRNVTTAKDDCSFTEASQCLQTADDTNAGETGSDTESVASDNTSSCSAHHRNISRVTERNILTLLSRISHSPETVAHVMNAGTICGLLDYAMLASDPLPAAGKTLLRLSRSHHGFQRALLCLFPLHAVWRNEPDCISSVPPPLSDKDSTGHHGSDLCTSCFPQADSCVGLDSVDYIASSREAQSGEPAINSSTELTESISEREKKCSWSLNMQTNCTTVRSAKAERVQQCVASKLCDEIIANLSTIAISGYGQGVVSHLLLRGSRCQRERCVISLCFLCRFVFVCDFSLYY